MAIGRDALLAVVGLQNEVVSTGLDLDAVMALVVRRTQELTRAAAGVIELAEGAEMVYVAVSGTAELYAGLRLDIMNSLSGLSVRAGEIMRCDDSETDPRVDREACRRVGARSMLCVPLRYREQPVGVLKVYSPESAHFDDDDRELLELMTGVIAASMVNAASYEERVRASLYDAHTSLPNRMLFVDRLEASLRSIPRKGPFSVMFLDLDGFKSVNDTFGHAAGDQVLRAVADVLRTIVRPYDTVARLHGDEFAILLGDAVDPGALAARILNAVGSVAEATWPIGVSIGGVVVRDHVPGEEVIAASDAAMYDAKRAGKGRFILGAPLPRSA